MYLIVMFLFLADFIHFDDHQNDIKGAFRFFEK